MRGQPVIFPPLSVRARIIPARAGPTVPMNGTLVVSADHPRSCGANAFTDINFAANFGSSPLVRGQQTLNYPVGMTGRIIPARAGPT